MATKSSKKVLTPKSENKTPKGVKKIAAKHAAKAKAFVEKLDTADCKAAAVEAPENQLKPLTDEQKKAADSEAKAPIAKKSVYICPKCGGASIEKTSKNSQSMLCEDCHHTANALQFLPKIAKKLAKKNGVKPQALKKTTAPKAAAADKPKSTAVKEHKERDGKPTVASVLRQCFRDGMDNEKATEHARKILGEDRVKNCYASWYRNEMKRKGIE